MTSECIGQDHKNSVDCVFSGLDDSRAMPQPGQGPASDALTSGHIGQTQHSDGCLVCPTATTPSGDGILLSITIAKLPLSTTALGYRKKIQYGSCFMFTYSKLCN